jgi:hypothetical protein
MNSKHFLLTYSGFGYAKNISLYQHCLRNAAKPGI